MKNFATKLCMAGIVCLFPLTWQGCKPKPSVLPQPDVEVEPAREAVYALQTISDIEMICSFAGENNITDARFYKPAPDNVISGADGDYNIIRDKDANYLFMAYNNTKCYDGKFRKGTVSMDFMPLASEPNATYCHRYKFQGRITLLDYRSDGWLIKTSNGAPCLMYNKLESPVFDPATGTLSWGIEGRFEFTHPSDPNKNMTCEVKLVKKLANAANPDVYKTGRIVVIDWTKAIVEYTGDIWGTTSGGKEYHMTLSQSNPVTRDFACFPDKAAGVVISPSFSTWTHEFHPFNKGMAVYKSGRENERRIFFGNEETRDLPEQCDNSGTVLIRGVSVKIDFIK